MAWTNSSDHHRDDGAPSLAGAIAALRRAWDPANQTRTAVFTCALGLLVASTLFGGASQTNTLSLMGVELASLPLLFIALYQMFAIGPPRGAWLPMALLAAIVAVPALQLVPLPPALWTQLPGRAPIAQVMDLAHLGRQPSPFSLAPQSTWRSLLALTPPAAMFLGALLLTDRQRRVMAGCWLALAIVSVCIGGLQMLGGQDSPFYFYSITNPDSAVGLFSNRNHEAAFLFCLIPLAAVFAAEFAGSFRDWRAAPSVLAILFLLVAIVGVAVTRSRAGVALTGAALLGAVAITYRAGVVQRHWRAAAGIGLGVAVAVVAVLLFGLNPILARFHDTVDLRFTGWPIVLKAAYGFLPLGSGIGSFETVYGAAEPLTQVTPIYFNHAHNDYLELWLETGVVGAALLGVFALWLALRAVVVWTSPSGATAADLPAACVLMMALLLAHSAVDYPLRTEALAVLFAFGCGTIAASVESSVDDRGRRSRRSGRVQKR